MQFKMSLILLGTGIQSGLLRPKSIYKRMYFKLDHVEIEDKNYFHIFSQFQTSERR